MLIVSFHNDGTGDEEVGHYIVQVRINTSIIWEGRIRNHKRREGWQGLVDLLKDKLNKEKVKEAEHYAKDWRG